MPGTVFELSLDDALAIVAAVEREPDLFWRRSVAEREALLAEARRVVEHAALMVAERCFPSPLSDRPKLKIVEGGK